MYGGAAGNDWPRDKPREFAKSAQPKLNGQIDDPASKVSYNDLVIKAAALALREFPNLNASLEGETLYDHPNIDINIAVAIDGGLIAPFVADADQKSLGTIARSAKALIKRAREGGLQPAEYQGGTFTITNPGVFGAQFGMPIINQPQVAILCVGAIEKRAVVVDDAIAIRPRAYLTLGYDHRLIDGAIADQFMSQVKERIEQFDPAGV